MHGPTPPADETSGPLRSVVEQQLERVTTLQDAEAVLAHAERLAAAKTEVEAGTPAAVQGARAVPRGEQLAPPGPPAARRGRSLLRQALLRRLGPLQALDARLYFEVNGQRHPPLLDRACRAITLITTGGWIWILGAVLANRLGVPRSRRALRTLVPSVVISTWIAEYPVKAYFRRRRPFIDVVRALVVGKEPGSWSFPSGHTSAAFASAWILSRYWPGKLPLFFGVAALVGYSRVYVGAHYPGDVAIGALLGMSLSELIRRITSWLLD